MGLDLSGNGSSETMYDEGDGNLLTTAIIADYATVDHDVLYRIYAVCIVSHPLIFLRDVNS